MFYPLGIQGARQFGSNGSWVPHRTHACRQSLSVRTEHARCVTTQACRWEPAFIKTGAFVAKAFSNRRSGSTFTPTFTKY